MRSQPVPHAEKLTLDSHFVYFTGQMDQRALREHLQTGFLTVQVPRVLSPFTEFWIGCGALLPSP